MLRHTLPTHVFTRAQVPNALLSYIYEFLLHSNGTWTLFSIRIFLTYQKQILVSPNGEYLLNAIWTYKILFEYLTVNNQLLNDVAWSVSVFFDLMLLLWKCPRNILCDSSEHLIVQKKGGNMIFMKICCSINLMRFDLYFYCFFLHNSHYQILDHYIILLFGIDSYKVLLHSQCSIFMSFIHSD